ncbi:aa3-type cytochrome c oxidase subunit IV [Sphingomonas jeddahensis]|jgi:hypothetical protein|uniref:Cytochrome c oxidase subunit IV bacterial aa3 type domain-containing protein n=1 Tax=Sphingomonas jeddahensis TaxID=1915074 RepID=A0A1V2ESM7_9SPHN|nr:aa3-type cytochrome c oxidase subunit IV [Sphingomonas jeddahensis]ONF95184.1 hypothetical protein SPHI_26020 [Sphingomonas jeddahensis]
MAQHGTNPGDYKTHESTYGKVMGMMKWGTVVCVALAALVVWLIA